MIDDPKGLMTLKFVCPICGGSCFGTINAGKDDAMGRCNTYKGDGTMCNFLWMRKDSDWKYFVKKDDEG